MRRNLNPASTASSGAKNRKAGDSHLNRVGCRAARRRKEVNINQETLVSFPRGGGQNVNKVKPPCGSSSPLASWFPAAKNAPSMRTAKKLEVLRAKLYEIEQSKATGS